MPPIERESGLNLPNVMTPGAWAILVSVSAIVLIAFAFLFMKWWKLRVKWSPLGFRNVQYFAEDVGFRTQFLINAIDKARAFLILNSHWTTSETDKALGAFNVYVFADDVNAGKVGLFGYEKDGVIGVNRKLTTLCHEMGHLLHERLERIVDYEHVLWEKDGFTKAEAAYSDWLTKQ